MRNKENSLLSARCTKCKIWINGFENLKKNNYFEQTKNFVCNKCKKD